MINPNSKISLKMSCLASCKGDIDQATKLYDFLVDGVDSIPDFDMPKPTAFQQLKDGANGLFGWIKDNRDDIINGIGLIQSLRNGGSILPGTASAVSEIPPIPTEEITE